MTKDTTVGIDIGTHHVKVVISQVARGVHHLPKIIGTGSAESRGMRHGYVLSSADTTRSIRAAIGQAEKVAGVKIERAYLAVGGIGLEEIRSRGETVVSRADQEVTDLDLEKALEDGEAKIAQKIVNKKIIHVIPIRYRLDGGEVLGRPIGLRGNKLEVDILFITCFEQHLGELIGAVEELGIEVDDVMASPLAASLVTLTKAQKIAGCVLANIGSETVAIAVFENNVPISVKVFPIGSTDVTNDIALGLKISLEEAEQIKLGAITGTTFSKKKLDEIISARLSDIFELIEAHLKKLGKNGLLPAGIILTGGGTGIATIETLARATLKLPSKVASLETSGEPRGITDSSWAVAYGLTIWGLTADDESGGSIKIVRKTGRNMLEWVKQFLP